MWGRSLGTGGVRETQHEKDSTLLDMLLALKVEEGGPWAEECSQPQAVEMTSRREPASGDLSPQPHGTELCQNEQVWEGMLPSGSVPWASRRADSRANVFSWALWDPKQRPSSPLGIWTSNAWNYEIIQLFKADTSVVGFQSNNTNYYFVYEILSYLLQVNTERKCCQGTP